MGLDERKADGMRGTKAGAGANLGFLQPPNRGRGPTVDWPREPWSCPVSSTHLFQAQPRDLLQGAYRRVPGPVGRVCGLSQLLCVPGNPPSTPEVIEGVTEALDGNPLWFMDMGRGLRPNSNLRNCTLHHTFARCSTAPAGHGGAGGAAVSRWRAGSMDGGWRGEALQAG